MTPRLRDDLLVVEPHRVAHVEAAVRLDTTEPPYPLPSGFAEALANALRRRDFHRRPDREAVALRTGLADLTGHPVAGVWAANGPGDAIQQLCLAFGGPGRRALVFQPTDALHSLIPRITGMEVAAERLGPDFRLRASVAADAVDRHRPAIVFVCSPNNPTGTAQSLEALRAMCEAAGQAVVVADETYGEPDGSVAPLLGRDLNLVVVRTLWAFARSAVGIGYCLADPAVVEDLARVGPPSSLSALTLAAGEVALGFGRQAAATIDLVREQRERIETRMSELEDVEVFPSTASFVVFRTPADAGALWRALLARGVLVRDVSAAPGLERCLRVTAGPPDETGAFLEALDHALPEVCR